MASAPGDGGAFAPGYAWPVLIALLGLSVLMVEGVTLFAVYLALQPESGSWLNVVVGTVGLLSMIAMLVYSVARRSKALRDVMRLSYWLQLHIFLGLQGVLLAFLHCLPLLWREGWPILLNPGMLNLYAVAVVFASGLFGRYLYALVPKAAGGQVLEGGRGEALLLAQRVFRYWIVLHRPIALGMYLLSAVHVLVALVYSRPWSWW